MSKFIGITLAVMAAAITGTFAPQLLHTAFAQISGLQITNQQHTCATVGGASGLTGCGNALATHSFTNTGGAINPGTGTGISIQQGTGQTTSCTTAGGTSPIGQSCGGTSTNTASNSGGTINTP